MKFQAAVKTAVFFLIVTAFSVRAASDSVFAGIIPGGTYRLQLTTGDIFEGVVESKDDTSLIIETGDRPFIFRGSLITNSILLAPPKGLARTEEVKSSGMLEAEIYTYDQLFQKGNDAGVVDIKIINGSVFRGRVVSVDLETVNLDIDGSRIPISSEVIEQISAVMTNVNAPAPDEPQAPAASSLKGPFDTVTVVNPETDEYGKAFPPLLIIGKISRDDATGITIETPQGLVRTLKRDRILRVNRHSSSPEEDKIKRYATPLFCPQDMALIDMPPGKPNLPFFKVCVDKYEYPNLKSAMPQGNASYTDAQQACASKGKRLCTAEEWQWSCSGFEGYTYPYGWQPDKKTCNSRGIDLIEPCGTRYNCKSKFNVFDMVGNIFEWVTGADGKPMLMGGPFSKCQTVSPGVGGEAKPQTGFRCCKSN
jgi:hypothetical protein